MRVAAIALGLVICLVPLSVFPAEYLSNEVPAMALRVEFSEPVTVTGYGEVFTSVAPESEAIEFLFFGGELAPWDGHWLSWQPAVAKLVVIEWLSERPPVTFLEPPFPYWGFTIPEIGGGEYSHGLLVPSVDGMICTGANAVILSPTLRMKSATASQVTTAGEETPESQIAALRSLIGYLRDAGVSVSIKPQLWPADGTWSALIEPGSPDRWFSSYKELLLGYAKLAEETGVTAIFLSNELESMVVNPSYEGAWRDIIEAMRDVFSGEISLNAIITSTSEETTTDRNVWQTEVMSIPFADALDFIGVSVYVPLTGKMDPTLSEIRKAWHGNREGLNIIHALKAIHELYGKPVMISEIAYRAIDGANIVPYMATDEEDDLQEQCDLLEAMLQVLSAQTGDWFRGVIVWGWFTYPKPQAQMTFLDRDNLSAAVQRRPSELLLTDWFHRLGALEPSQSLCAARPPLAICYDMSHDQRLVLTEERARVVDPLHPEWFTLAALEPHVTREHESGELSENALADVDILIIASPMIPLTAAERRALESYVDEGGGLLVVGDAWGAQLDLRAFGLQLGRYTIGETSHLHDFASFEAPCQAHPATAYSSTMQVNWGCSMTVDLEWTTLAESSAQSWEERTGDSQLSANERQGPFPLLAVREFGEGRIVAVADEQPFTRYGDSFLVRKLIDWLSRR